MAQHNRTKRSKQNIKSDPDTAESKFAEELLLELPTVQEVTQNQFDQKRGIKKSFRFDPVPDHPDLAYSGEVNILSNGKVIIRLNPPHGFLRSVGDSQDDLFDFSGSPLSFAKNIDYALDKAAMKEYDTQKEAYEVLFRHYKWLKERNT